MATEFEELQELETKYKEERYAIILKHRKDKSPPLHTTLHTRELVKELVLSRCETFTLQEEKEKLTKAIEAVNKSIFKIRQKVNSTIVPKLLESYPDRCMECGAPEHTEFECTDDVHHSEPIDYVGNRFYWDIPFTDRETLILNDYNVSTETVIDIFESKAKEYPIDPYIMHAVSEYQKNKK